MDIASKIRIELESVINKYFATRPEFDNARINKKSWPEEFFDIGIKRTRLSEEIKSQINEWDKLKPQSVPEKHEIDNSLDDFLTMKKILDCLDDSKDLCEIITCIKEKNKSILLDINFSLVDSNAFTKGPKTSEELLLLHEKDPQKWTLRKLAESCYPGGQSAPFNTKKSWLQRQLKKAKKDREKNKREKSGY